MQMASTAVVAVFNYIMTNEIITNQFDTLLSIEGTNVWSGQQAQAFNSLAVAWGGLFHELFSVGGTYQWMTLIFIPGFFVPIPFWLLHKKYPKPRPQQHQHRDYDHISLMAMRRHQLVSHGILLLRFGQSDLHQEALPNTVRQVQLPCLSCARWWHFSHCVILSFAVFGAAGNIVNFRESFPNNPVASVKSGC
jgi:hypothetical protein